MIKSKKIVAIIPARGGSKSLPKKNIKPLCGKPLILWSIEAAKESKYIDRVVVSTEDKEIGGIAERGGAEVLWRPRELASDTATTVSVLQHALENIPLDIIVLLQPTSPIRINNLIDRAIERFLESEADTLATGFIRHDYQWGTFNNLPRQQLKGWFYDDGNIYIHKPDYLKQGKWFGQKREQMVIDKYYNFEIDEEVNFFIIENLMKNYIKNKIKNK